jgi:hypothetical protein
MRLTTCVFGACNELGHAARRFEELLRAPRAFIFRELRPEAAAPRLPPALLRFDEAPRELDDLAPELLRRAVLPREVRVPVSPDRPRELDFLALEPELRVDEERGERALPRDELREVVDFEDARPSVRLRLRERLPLAERELDVERDPPREPLRLPALLDRPPLRALPRCPRDSACCAVSRLTILLKLLRCPLAAVSWKSSARPRSSNLSNHSSHEISSSEFSPE